MKINAISLQNSIFYLLFLSVWLIITGTAYPQDHAEIIPGAKGKVCLKCHEKFKETVRNRYVHPLMKNGECTGCHVPHASSHKNLLTAGPSMLCYDCHKKILPENANSAHGVVNEGRCDQCHNSHGSNYQFILKRSGNSLCLDCHKDLNETINKNRFNHGAMKTGKGCLNCHEPHASNRFKKLLKNDAPALCLRCHTTDKPSFKQKHLNYAVADSNCNSCHNPHGSEKKGILFASVHKPVSEKKCTECHAGPASSTPLKVMAQGSELCRKCHKDMMDNTLKKDRVHWPLMNNTGCLNCHTPHGAKQKMLLKGSVSSVCGACHSDTIELQKQSIENPENKMLCEPVKTGNCVTCHSPHSSDSVLLMVKPTGFELCGTCHEWQTHSTHPIGEKITDTRNKNLALDCYSCHNGCGTKNKPFMLHYGTTHEVCIQCHIERLKS